LRLCLRLWSLRLAIALHIAALIVFAVAHIISSNLIERMRRIIREVERMGQDYSERLMILATISKPKRIGSSQQRAVDYQSILNFIVERVCQGRARKLSLKNVDRLGQVTIVFAAKSSRSFYRQDDRLSVHSKRLSA
jgi:hypothetical protein